MNHLNYWFTCILSFARLFSLSFSLAQLVESLLWDNKYIHIHRVSVEKTHCHLSSLSSLIIFKSPRQRDTISRHSRHVMCKQAKARRRRNNKTQHRWPLTSDSFHTHTQIHREDCSRLKLKASICLSMPISCWMVSPVSRATLVAHCALIDDSSWPHSHHSNEMKCTGYNTTSQNQ